MLRLTCQRSLEVIKRQNLLRRGAKARPNRKEKVSECSSLVAFPHSYYLLGWKANWGRGAWGCVGFLVPLRRHLHAKCKQLKRLLCKGCAFLHRPPSADWRCRQEARFGTACLCGQCPLEAWAWHGGSQRAPGQWGCCDRGQSWWPRKKPADI